MEKEAFSDNRQIWELKWGGWRILLYKDGVRLEALTRNGMNVTSRFPELQEAVRSIHAHRAVLDCEGICFRDAFSMFDDFTYRGQLSDARKIATAAPTHPATLVAYTDGDHTQEPLIDWKARLNYIIEPSNFIVPSMYIEGFGVQLKTQTEEWNWEGIVAKRKDSRYVTDIRSMDWLKIKNWKEIDVVILGYRVQPRFGLIVGLHFPTMDNKPDVKA